MNNSASRKPKTSNDNVFEDNRHTRSTAGQPTSFNGVGVGAGGGETSRAEREPYNPFTNGVRNNPNRRRSSIGDQFNFSPGEDVDGFFGAGNRSNGTQSG
jgi:hypothetical protein